MEEEETRPEGEREDVAAAHPHDHRAEASSPLEAPPAAQYINDSATSDTAIDDDYDLLLQEAQAVTAALPVAADDDPALDAIAVAAPPTAAAAVAVAVDKNNKQFDAEEDEYERLLREADAVAAASPAVAVAAAAASDGDDDYERLLHEADPTPGTDTSLAAAVAAVPSAPVADAVEPSSAAPMAAEASVEAAGPEQATESAEQATESAEQATEPAEEAAEPAEQAAVSVLSASPAEAATAAAAAAAVAVPTVSAAEAVEMVDADADDAYERLLREEQPAAPRPVADSAPQPPQKPQPPPPKKKLTLEALQRYTPPPSSSQAATSARPLLRPISASRAALDATEPPPRKPAVPRLSAAALGAARKTFLTALPGDAAAATQPAKAPALNHAVRYDVDRRCVKLTAECPHRVAFAACGNFFCQTALAGHALLLSMHDKCAQAQRLVATLDELLHERLAARLEAEVVALRRAHREELARLRDELQRFSKTQQTTLDAYARAAKFAYLLQTVDVEDAAPREAARPSPGAATEAAPQTTRPAERKSNEQLFVQAAGLSTDAFFHLRRQVDVIRETRAQHQRSVLDNARFEQEQAVQLLRQHGLALPQRFLRTLRDGYEDALRFQYAKVETLVQYLLQLTVAPLRGGRDLSVLPSLADRAHVRRVKRLAAELHSLHRVALGVFARLSEEVRGLFAQLHDEVDCLMRTGRMRSVVPRALAALDAGGARDASREAAALRRSHSAAASLPTQAADRAAVAPDAPQSASLAYDDDFEAQPSRSKSTADAPDEDAACAAAAARHRSVDGDAIDDADDDADDDGAFDDDEFDDGDEATDASDAAGPATAPATKAPKKTAKRRRKRRRRPLVSRVDRLIATLRDGKAADAAILAAILPPEARPASPRPYAERPTLQPGSFTPLGTRRFRMTLEEQRAFARRHSPRPASPASPASPVEDATSRRPRSAEPAADAPWHPQRCAQCRGRFRGDGLRQLPSLLQSDGAVRRRAGDTVARIDSLLANFEKKVAVSAVDQLRLERRLCRALQASAAAPRPSTPTAARDPRDAGAEEAPVYCSWTCLKRWAHAARPPQQRYHVDLVVDVAAGCAVPP